MTSPTPGSAFGSSTVTFNWTAGSASAYWLYLGSSLGTYDIYNSGSITVRSKTVSGIPTDGRTIYVRLWSRVGTSWKFIDYTYTASSS